MIQLLGRSTSQFDVARASFALAWSGAAETALETSAASDESFVLVDGSGESERLEGDDWSGPGFSRSSEDQLDPSFALMASQDLEASGVSMDGSYVQVPRHARHAVVSPRNSRVSGPGRHAGDLGTNGGWIEGGLQRLGLR